jgi:5-methylcytosine-specific restriction protein B
MTREEILQAIEDSGVVAETREARTSFQELTILDDDPTLQRVRQLIDDGYAGVIFVGPPGTGKSWYANQIALALADGDSSRVRKIQFHRSFQYEQFVEGFVPNDAGTGFELKPQIMLRVMKDADDNPGTTYVVLIDELSRSDPGRVFGELLTYMEPTRRDEAFLLASGHEVTVPPDLVFLATMNSRDKNVAEIDDAFDRRLAKIEFPPSVDVLERFLGDNGVPDEFRRRIVGFFRWVQAKYPIGHTFFRTVKDEEGLRRLWETQLRFTFEKQYKYEPETMEEIRAKFTEITGVTVS